MDPSSSPHQPQTKLPWSPTSICWICILTGALPGVVMWAVNNRRLSLSPSIATRVFVGASLALYFLVLGRLLSSEYGSFLDIHFRYLAIMTTLILSWQLFVSQRSAFARYRRAGGKTASLWGPILTGMVWAFLLAGAQVGIETVRTDRDYDEFNRIAATLPTSDAKSRQAEVFFLDFKRKHPEETMVHWYLALIYEQTDRIEQARQELRELLHEEPKNKEARDFLRQLEEP